MLRWSGLVKILCGLLLAFTLLGQPASLAFLNRNRPVLDAHNCYPYEGRWQDRLDRALKSGFPVGIEQDLTWHVDPATGAGRIAISHQAETTGSEPGLREYFFEAVRPIFEKALADHDRARWPLIILHFDFKSTPAPLLHAVWDLLGQYESWITTARQTANPRDIAPLERGPILVLTEESDAQEEVFFHQVPAGARLRVFGSARTVKVPGDSARERDHYARRWLPRNC